MRFEDLNWMDVEAYLEKDDRIIIITGATEQHAYVSLLTDIIIPSKLADAVAAREKVLIAPPLNFGYSRYFAAFPGTISLTQNTLSTVILEIFECLLHQGFRRFFFLNGHGGNLMPGFLRELDKHDDALNVIWYNWWREKAVQNFGQRESLRLNHANWGENFPFNRVAESPEEVKEWVDRLTDDNDIYQIRQQIGDGSFGGPYEVSDDIMNQLFTEVVDEAVTLIHNM